MLYENVEAFKASFAGARLLNHRSFQINAIMRLVGVVWDGLESLGCVGAVWGCEAFKASFAGARLLNQQAGQIKTPARLGEGVRVDLESLGCVGAVWGMREASFAGARLLNQRPVSDQDACKTG